MSSTHRPFTHLHSKGKSERIWVNMCILKERFCTLFFRPRTRPKTSLQCFALEQRESKAKHCRDVLGRKNEVKNQSFKYKKITLMHYKWQIILLELFSPENIQIHWPTLYQKYTWRHLMMVSSESRSNSLKTIFCCCSYLFLNMSQVTICLLASEQFPNSEMTKKSFVRV